MRLSEWDRVSRLVARYHIFDGLMDALARVDDKDPVVVLDVTPAGRETKLSIDFSGSLSEMRNMVQQARDNVAHELRCFDVHPTL